MKTRNGDRKFVLLLFFFERLPMSLRTWINDESTVTRA